MSRAGEISNDLQSVRRAARPALIQVAEKYRLSINIIQYPEGEDDALRRAIEGQLKSMLQRALEKEQAADEAPKSGHGLIRALILTVVGVALATLVYIFVWPLLNKWEADEVAKVEVEEVDKAKSEKANTPPAAVKEQRTNEFETPLPKASTVAPTPTVVETVKVSKTAPPPPVSQKTKKLEDLID